MNLIIFIGTTVLLKQVYSFNFLNFMFTLSFKVLKNTLKRRVSKN